MNRIMYGVCMIIFLIMLLHVELLWATIFLLVGILFNELDKAKNSYFRTVVMPKKPTTPPGKTGVYLKPTGSHKTDPFIK